MNADKNPIYIEGDPEHSDLSKRHMFYLFMKKLRMETGDMNSV